MQFENHTIILIIMSQEILGTTKKDGSLVWLYGSHYKWQKFMYVSSYLLTTNFTKILEAVKKI